MFLVRLVLFFAVTGALYASGAAKKEVNLVFIGKTGTGKSSLINIFYNHIVGAKSPDSVHVVVPLCHNDKIYTVNVSDYEDLGVVVRCSGESETKKVNKYIAESESLRIVLWDTPGFMDTEGGITDEQHMKTIALALKDVQIHSVIFVSDPTDFRRHESFEFKANINLIQRMLPKSFKQNLVAVFNSQGKSISPAGRTKLHENFDDFFKMKEDKLKSKAYFIDGSSFFEILSRERGEDTANKWKVDDLVVTKLIEDTLQKLPADGRESYHVSELDSKIISEVDKLTETLLDLDRKKSYLTKKKYELKNKEELRDSNADYSKTRQIKVPEHVEDNILCLPFYCFTKGRDVERIITDNFIDEAQRSRYQDALTQIGTISGQVSFCQEEISDLEQKQRKVACEIVKSQQALEKLAMTTDYSPYLQYLQKQKIKVQKDPKRTDSAREHLIKQYNDWIQTYKQLTEERICEELTDL
jgi:hypothetical protein